MEKSIHATEISESLHLTSKPKFLPGKSFIVTFTTLKNKSSEKSTGNASNLITFKTRPSRLSGTKTILDIQQCKRCNVKHSIKIARYSRN
jgi:hypothetical protein